MNGTAAGYAGFTLPPSVVTKIDVSRLVTEIERVDDELTTASVRTKAGAAPAARRPLSTELTEFMNQNALHPANSKERTDLVKQMRLLKDHVPIIHMTFAVEADKESLQQLVAWIRGSIHPQAVIEVGLQPGLIAGVYLRTPNHVQDLSLRAMLKGGRGLLVKELAGLMPAAGKVADGSR